MVVDSWSELGEEAVELAAEVVAVVADVVSLADVSGGSKVVASVGAGGSRSPCGGDWQLEGAKTVIQQAGSTLESKLSAEVESPTAEAQGITS